MRHLVVTALSLVSFDPNKIRVEAVRRRQQRSLPAKLFALLVSLTRTLSDNLIHHLQHQNNEHINHDHGTFRQHRARISNPHNAGTHRHFIFPNSKSASNPTSAATPAPPQLQAEPQQHQGRSYRSLRWHRCTICCRCRSHRLRECEGGSLWRAGGAVRGGNLDGTGRIIGVEERFVRSPPLLSFSALSSFYIQALLPISQHS